MKITETLGNIKIHRAVEVMSSYKLTYFDIRGKAEIIRLILAQVGVEYEDIRIGQDEWREHLKQSNCLFHHDGFDHSRGVYYL